MNETIAGASYEHLIGGHETPTFLENVGIDSTTTVERGMLLAGTIGDSGATVHIATNADANAKLLYIAAEDAASVPVVPAYSAGRFNRSEIKLSEGVSIEAFEPELRRQGIFLTGVLK